jgi:hypothetical protein
MIGKVQKSNINKQFIVFLLFLTLTSCIEKNKKHDLSDRKLLQISFSTDGRKQDTTGGFAIEINNNCVVNYYGSSQSGLSGKYESKIEKSYWDRISKLINNTELADTIYSESNFEDNYFDLSFQFKNQNYYLQGFYSHAPKKLQEIIKQILLVKKKMKSKKTFKNQVFKVRAYKKNNRLIEEWRFEEPICL